MKMKNSCKKFSIFLVFYFLLQIAHAKDYFIFSILQDIPMGYENEIVKKNYYVSLGTDHGLSHGSLLNVYRRISTNNPYDNQNRINYKIKVGELEVIHTESSASITKARAFTYKDNKISLEVDDFMIGDYVSVKVKP
jgi:hypothetical protein